MKSHPAASTPPALASKPLLSVELGIQGTTRLVTVAGEMDVSTVTEVQRVVDRALRERPETLLLDLGGLGFCDSTGVHLVVQTHRRATVQGARLLVVPPVGPARRVFDVCHIGDHVTFIDGETEE